MPKLDWNSAAGNLTIGGVAMNCAGWKVLNLHVLWQPANVRGSDRIVPGATGVIPFRRRATVTTHSLQMLVSGTHDRTGSANANKFVGLQANVDYLIANVVAPTGTGDGTRSAVLTMPDASVRTEPVHVLGMDFGDASLDGSWLKAVIELSVPTGRII
jgi:hypothetical protein